MLRVRAWRRSSPAGFGTRAGGCGESRRGVGSPAFARMVSLSPGARSIYSPYVALKIGQAYAGPMNAEIIVPVTVFAMYAVALVATAAVCYKFRDEIFA